MSNAETEFRAALAKLLNEAVDSARSYTTADEGNRMAHVIGYLAGAAHMQSPIERLFSAEESVK